MRLPLVALALRSLTFALAFTACPVDDAAGDEGEGEGDQGEGEGEGDEGEGEGEGDVCTEGCVLTLAADCANGPASQAQCETDCNALLAGACAAEYTALIACADGEAVTCDANDLPSVDACADDENTFRACLNG